MVTASSSSTSTEVVVERKIIPKRKRGRRSLLGDKLDDHIMNYIAKLRASGGIVNSSLMLAAAEGIVQKYKPSLLSKNGGPIVLKKSWAISMLKRTGYSKRKGTKAARKLPQNYEVIKTGFLNKVRRSVHSMKVPPSMVINWDQTGSKLTPTSEWTMAMTGSKQVPIIAVEDKREITVLLAITAAGMMLPPQVNKYKVSFV